MRAHTIAVSSNAKDIERQMRDAGVILARTWFGSQRLTNRGYQRFQEDNGVWLDVELTFQSDDNPPDFQQEVALAMVPVWVSWWLADKAVEVIGLSPYVLTRAADLISLGTEWRTALSMAELESMSDPADKT